MATAAQSLTEAGSGPQALTPVEAHWFTPIFTDGGGNTVVSDPYTTNYNNGTAPFNVTLTDTNIDANDVAGTTTPIASYATGYNFHIASALQASGNKVIVYDVADGTYPQSSAVDIDAQTVDSQGNPIGTPVTLQSDVQNVRQFRVGSAAIGNNGYVLTYATVNTTTVVETVSYQGYTAAGTAIAGDGGTLDTFNTTGTGESFGFGTLHPSTAANPSFVYLRGSNNNGQYSNNVGVKYETVSTTGQPSGGLTLITPPYPTGSTSPDLLNYSYERLTPTAASQNDLAIIMRYSYVDASGATQEALDVHTLNTATGVGADHTIALAGTDTDTSLTQTVLANGDIAVGYNDGSSQPLKVQIFDTNGNPLGAPLTLPSSEAGFQLDTNAAGQVIVEYTATGGTGQQLDYDVYNVNAAGLTPASPTLNQLVTYDGGGTFTLTGTVGSSAASGVEITATVDGTVEDLGAATLNGDGTFTFTDAVGANIQGFITATETDTDGAQSSGQANYSLQGGLSGTFTARQTSYTPDGNAETAVTKFRDDGSRVVNVKTDGTTYTSSFFDTFQNNGEPSNTFVFTQNHGLDTIKLFRVAGADHDTISLPQSDFTSVAEVLQNTTSKGGTSTIVDPVTGDAIRLAGVTKAQLTANQGDFTFHA